eukprot:TRINITY_DN8677_c0_g1_i1.p1 TRINITY_DN8677_c0_g1~~TRINITY_DN8677_c0_g1_i1.p1  ORF type:complete len:329 (-),score=57.51 TRINITY_DN8677_c0_g1_i1:33-1019(-)
MKLSSATVGGIFILVIAVVVFLIRKRASGKRCDARKDLSGKVVLLTGGNSGIGLATAIELAEQRATLIISVRDENAGKRAVEEIVRKSGNPNVSFLLVDLGDLASVRSFCEKFKEKVGRLDILVLNAGIAQGPSGAGETSKDGYEIVFATNHLGHFAIFQHLKQLLTQSQGRVVTVASMVHKQGRLNLDRVAVADPTSSTRDLYNTSKLCNILFSYELHKRYNHVGIKSYCLSPGLVKTNLFRHFNFKKLTPGALLFGLVILPLIGRTCEQGAQTVLYCSMADIPSGKYYSDCKEQKSSQQTYDEKLAEQLWGYSESLLEEADKKRGK